MEDNQQQQNLKRPVLLTVLAILSFITISFGLIGNFLNLFSGPLSAEEMDLVITNSKKILEPFSNTGMSDMTEIFDKTFQMQVYINSNFYMHTLFTLAGLATGFYGVRQMLQAKKIGFHYYIIYNLLSLVSIYVSVPTTEVPSFIIISNVIFSGLFIFLYSINLSWMQK
jgi:hypothetical protein